jgi:hypothetical protein
VSPTEPEVLTVAQAVNRAVDVVDPRGRDERLADLYAAFQDRDQPVTSAQRELEEELTRWVYRLDLQEDDPAVDVAIAIATYLIFKRGQVGDSDDELLTLAVRAEYHDSPPEHVAAWLDGR